MEIELCGRLHEQPNCPKPHKNALVFGPKSFLFFLIVLNLGKWCNKKLFFPNLESCLRNKNIKEKKKKASDQRNAIKLHNRSRHEERQQCDARQREAGTIYT